MSISRQQVGRFLYAFVDEYTGTYVNFSSANELADAQLIMTLERGCERQTFAFSQPHFNDIERNLITSKGVYVASLKNTPLSPHRVEVGDLEGGFAYFTAKNVKNITPTA
jgi:hypothetical protein